MTSTSVLELVENIRAGREVQKAQEELYPLVEEALLHRIRAKITARLRTRVDAEDVLHEAFLRAMGALDLFEPRSERAFFAWVFTIARNLCLDTAKRRSVGAARFVADSGRDGPRASQIPAGGRRPESQMERHDWLKAVLDRLKEQEAEVIRLHKIDGLSFEQIAESWGKTPSAVQRYFSRAWKKLRDSVEGDLP